MPYRLFHEVQNEDCYIRENYDDEVNVDKSIFSDKLYKRRTVVFVFCAGFVSGILLSLLVGIIMETNIQHGKNCQGNSANLRGDISMVSKRMKTTTWSLQNVSIPKITPTGTPLIASTSVDVTTELRGIVTSTKSYRDSGYSKYVIMFIEPYSTSTYPTLFILSDERGKANITSLSVNWNITPGINTIKLGRSILMKDGMQNKAIHITSSVPILVYGYGEARDTSEGFLAIPTKYLSQKYIVPSFTVWKSRSLSKSLIGIVPIYNNTLVKIKLKTKSGSVKYIKRTYSNGDVIQIQMSAFQSVQLSHNIDLSGSIVTSTHPVAVISGNKCNSITHAPCNHFSEMVLPENQLDNSYIVPVVEARPQSTVRILCPNNASVDIKTDKEQLHVDLKEGEFYDFNHWKISYIASTGDVLVTIFPHELKASKGDSYMMTVIGQHQYKSDYHFPVPKDFDSSFVSITVIGDKTEGFEMDGIAINPKKVSKISFQQKTYTTFSYSISKGSHKIRHVSGVKFGLWVYGSKWHDGFGYPAGISYK